MNDAYDLEEEIRSHTNGLPHITAPAATKLEQRAERRAAALNAVDLARRHANRNEEPYSQSEADVIMVIMELLDRVAGNGG